VAKKTKREYRVVRHKRVRRKVQGTPERPRMSVFRSARHISVQIIDDVHAVTLVSASTLTPELRNSNPDEGKIGKARLVGREIANRAREKGIEEVIFDRGGYQYHGRVRALADAAREAGLRF